MIMFFLGKPTDTSELTWVIWYATLSLYIPLTGQPEIWKNHIIALLDRVLIKYAPKANITLYYTECGGKVFYYKHLYSKVATEAGLMKEENHYVVPTFVEGTRPSGEKQDALFDTVMEMLSEDDDDDDDDDETNNNNNNL